MGNTPKIALLDLNHSTFGVHTNTVPLSCLLISSYLKRNVEHKLDIRVYKEHEFLIDDLKYWTPDLVGLAQYVWNSELNLYFAKEIKKINSSCVVVAGGPNLYQSYDEKLIFLKKESVIDICVSYDGEIPFTEITKSFPP